MTGNSFEHMVYKFTAETYTSPVTSVVLVGRHRGQGAVINWWFFWNRSLPHTLCPWLVQLFGVIHSISVTLGSWEGLSTPKGVLRQVRWRMGKGRCILSIWKYVYDFTCLSFEVIWLQARKQILPKAKKEREEEQEADPRIEDKAGFVGLGRFRE